MYEEHFGFHTKPFGKTPNPAFLYRSPIHEEALARLQYGTEERELTLLTGEIGTGKTLLAVAAELGDVFADPVLQVQDPPLVELVNHDVAGVDAEDPILRPRSHLFVRALARGADQVAPLIAAFVSRSAGTSIYET